MGIITTWESPREECSKTLPKPRVFAAKLNSTQMIVVCPYMWSVKTSVDATCGAHMCVKECIHHTSLQV